MSERFFVDSPITGSHAELTGPEAHHALHVMRLKVGGQITLFDGEGCEFTAQIVATERAALKLEIEERHEIDRELSRPLILGVALPKGDRQKWLLEKATEMGVTTLVPLNTARSVAQPRSSSMEKLRRSIIEASKQCGRNRLLELAPPTSFGEFLKSAGDGDLRLLAHPDGATIEKTLRDFQPESNTAAVCIAIGPEGGFAPEEVKEAEHAGWRPLSLGPRILRIETAALALAARFSFEREL